MAVQRCLEVVDTAEQRPQADPDQVGHDGVVEVEWRCRRAGLAAGDDLPRHTDHDGVGWHGLTTTALAPARLSLPKVIGAEEI